MDEIVNKTDEKCPIKLLGRGIDKTVVTLWLSNGPKPYAKDIEDETKSQNLFLDQMQNSFYTANDLLSNTLYRVLGIPKSRTQNRKFLCYTVLFVVSLVFVLYFMLFHRSSP